MGLDRDVEELQEHKDAWVRVPLGRKVALLDEVMRGLQRVAERQVSASNAAKAYPDGTALGGEEWAQPYAVTRLARLLRESLAARAENRPAPLPKGAVRVRANGQLAVRVFPVNASDALLFRGFRADVWLQSDVQAADLQSHTAGAYRDPDIEGKVALVLGAGNVASIGPMDILHKLFAEQQVCLFKHSPVNDYLHPFLEEAFAPLIRDGYLRLAHGGADVGEQLCLHSGVDEIHVTGSARTWNAIVYGAGEAGEARRRARQRRFEKRVTGELGNVSPVIVVPGRWSDSDLRFHAHNIATQVANNCSFNCVAAKALVLHRGWPQAGRFLDALRDVLRGVPARRAYYPGAEERYHTLLPSLPSAEPMGAAVPGIVPYTLVPDLDPAQHDHPCFATECFMPLLAQTWIDGRDEVEFLHNAVDFVNDRLFGTLNASIIVHPAVQERIGPELERQIERLRYGTVTINQWTGLAYAWGSLPWGAWPEWDAADIQSGAGFVHNGFLLDRPQKSVVYAPFRTSPLPAWFVTSPRTHSVFRAMTRHEAKPGLGRAARVVLAAVGF